MAREWPETYKFLNRYGESIVKESKTRLRTAGSYPGSKAGGPLEKSIAFKPYESRRQFGVTFEMEDYGQFVDQGVRGWKTGKTKNGTNSPFKFKPKKPGGGTGKKSKFIESLMKWTQKVGLPKGAAFAIRRNIWAKGIESTYFFTVPFTRSEKRFESGLEKAMTIDIENNIQSKIK